MNSYFLMYEFISGGAMCEVPPKRVMGCCVVLGANVLCHVTDFPAQIVKPIYTKCDLSPYIKCVTDLLRCVTFLPKIVRNLVY